MLVEPVAHEAADDPLVPPALGAHVVDPRLRRVPVVVDVVVVEDHRRRHRREQPAHVGLAPRLPVQPRVLLEVGDGLARRHLGVAARADELAHVGRDLVGVDLVAEQDHRLGPLGRVLRRHPLRERVQGVDLAALGVLVLGQRVRRLVRRADAAGAEHDPRRLRLVVGADHARRKPAVAQRPHRLAVERHLVRRDRPRLEPVAQHERVVVALDAERRRLAAEHRDRARRVGLDPDQRLGLPGVAQRRAQEQFSHAVPASGRLP